MSLDELAITHFKIDLIVMKTFFNSISDWQQLFVGFPCNNCGGFYSDSSFINVLSGNGMFLGTIIIVAPIVSLIFGWIG